LRALPATGCGIARRCVPAEGFLVRQRQGGERCQPAGRAHGQSLKHALQKARVPPWERPFVPLIMAGEQLAAVGGVLVCAGFDAQAAEPGWTLHWVRD
jgi:tRNA(Ile)-lysidine synthase